MNPEQLKEMMEALGKAFEDFKAANDDRLAQIETKGSADVVTIEKVDRINADVGKLSATIDKANELAAAAETRLDSVEQTVSRGRLQPETDALPGERPIAEHAARFYAGQVNDSVEQARRMLGVTPEQVDAYGEYKAAFVAVIRFGKQAEGQFQAALSVGSDPDGGYWVPSEVADRITTRLFETSPMRQIANVINIGTDAYEIPNDSNDAVSGGWVGEKAARPETGTPQVGMLRIPVHEQYASPKATQKVLDDAVIDIEGWLAGKITSKLLRDENNAFVVGNGVAKPRGFLDYGAAATTQADAVRTWGVLQYTFTGAAADFAASDPGDALIDLIHTLNPAYRQNAQWLMNRATAGAVRKFKDGQGNYLWSSGFQTGQPASLLGFGLTEAEDMPDVAADSFSVAFGDFRQGYDIIDRLGIRVLRDPFTDKPNIIFYTTKRAGGDVENYDSIKLLKTATS